MTNAKSPLGEFALNVGKTLAMFNFTGDGNWRQNIAGAPELYFPVGILFLLGIVLALMSLWRSIKKKNEDGGVLRAQYPAFSVLIIFVWFILAVLPAAASDEGIPHALRSILTLPPAIFLAAIAGVWAYQVIRDNGFKKTATTLMLLFVVIVGANAYISYFIVWAKNPNVYWAFNENYVQIGNQMNALARKHAQIRGRESRRRPRARHSCSRRNRHVRHRFLHDLDPACEPYHLPAADQTSTIPAGTPTSKIFYVN